MLLRFRVSNHRSILEPVELSMIAVDEDRSATRGFEGLSERVLTVAGIYGPNASGKSNVLDAMAWLSMAVTTSLRGWEDYIPRDAHRFGKCRSACAASPQPAPGSLFRSADSAAVTSAHVPPERIRLGEIHVGVGQCRHQVLDLPRCPRDLGPLRHPDYLRIHLLQRVPYSKRSVRIGSTRVARRAGSQQATSATATSTTGAPMKVRTSSVATP